MITHELPDPLLQDHENDAHKLKQGFKRSFLWSRCKRKSWCDSKWEFGYEKGGKTLLQKVNAKPLNQPQTQTEPRVGEMDWLVLLGLPNPFGARPSGLPPGKAVSTRLDNIHHNIYRLGKTLRRWEGPHYLELCPHPSMYKVPRHLLEIQDYFLVLSLIQQYGHIDSRVFPQYPIPEVMPFTPSSLYLAHHCWWIVIPYLSFKT